MYDQRPRRKARALAISETVEARGRTLFIRVMMVCGFALGFVEAGLALRHVMAAH